MTICLYIYIYKSVHYNQIRQSVMQTKNKKLLFNKSDIARMLGVTIGVLRFATQYANCSIINWKERRQLLNDSEVFNVIKAVRTRLSETEIKEIIEKY